MFWLGGHPMVSCSSMVDRRQEIDKENAWSMHEHIDPRAPKLPSFPLLNMVSITFHPETPLRKKIGCCKLTPVNWDNSRKINIYCLPTSWTLGPLMKMMLLASKPVSLKDEPPSWTLQTAVQLPQGNRFIALPNVVMPILTHLPIHGDLAVAILTCHLQI